MGPLTPTRKDGTMAEQFSAEWARGIIENGVEKAQGLMNDPEQINALLQDLQEKLKTLPDTVTKAFSNVPLMASMVKSYVTREYTEVSPKVVISLSARSSTWSPKRTSFPTTPPSSVLPTTSLSPRLPWPSTSRSLRHMLSGASKTV